MNSSLASYIDRGSGNYSRRTGVGYATKICIHDACAEGDCSTLSDIIKSAPYASFHYGIATDGTIGVYVDERYRAWGTGNAEIDNESVDIVVCNSSASGSYPISNEAYEALLKLCTDICRRNFIQTLTYTGRPSTSNLIKHSWYSSVDCPKAYLSSLYPSIASEVTRRLRTPQLATSETEAYRSQTNIVVDAIDPFIVTIDASTTGVDYNKLRTAGVVGAMFYAGALYQPGFAHVKNDRYVNPKLKAQMQEIGDTMPFALWCSVRARNPIEAKEECDELFYIISKYPPKLGIWLGLELPSASRSVNDPIIDVYYRWCVEWGLKDSCGFYCNYNQLNRVSWNNYYNKFSLWIIDMQSSVSNLYDLQTPNFFKV